MPLFPALIISSAPVWLIIPVSVLLSPLIPDQIVVKPNQNMLLYCLILFSVHLFALFILRNFSILLLMLYNYT